MQFHWWYVLLYALVPMLFDIVLQVTELKEEIGAPLPASIAAYLLWPVTLSLLTVVFTLVGVVKGLAFLFKNYSKYLFAILTAPFKVYSKYIIEPLRTKYKKRKWTIENAKALKQRKIV
jgi:hypothetical protein